MQELFRFKLPYAKKACWILAIIIVIGFLLRVIAINSALPYLYHPDEFQVVQVYLNMVKNTDLNPHWFTYPSLMMYINALVYGLYFLVRHFLGSFHRADIAFPQVPVMGTGIIEDPNVFLLGRSVSLLFGLGVILLVYQCSNRIDGRKSVGLLAALFTAVSTVNVEQSRLILPNIFLAFSATAVLLFSLRAYQLGKIQDYMFAGLFAGLSVASKYNGALVIVWIITAFFLRESSNLRRIYLLIASGGAALLGFFIASPYAILDWNNFLPMMLKTRAEYSTGWPGQEGQSLAWYIQYLINFEGVFALAAVASVVWGIAKKDKTIILLSSFPVVYFIYISSLQIRNEKTILPILPAIYILAAFLFEKLFGKIKSTFANIHLRRIIIIVLVILSLVVPGKRTYISILSAILPNSRETARVWINENLPNGAVIAFEAYSPYIDPERYQAIPVIGYEPKPLSWYTHQNVQYLIFSQGMYGRYYNEPHKYAKEITKYEDIFSQLEEVKIFRDGGYEVRIYKIPNSP